MTKALTYILDASFDKEKLVVSFFEEGSTLQSKANVDVSWDKIHSQTLDVISLLHQENLAHHTSSHNIDDLKKIGHFLFDELLPNEVKLKLKSLPHAYIIILIDEKFVSIPWELLHDGNNFLCLKFALGRIVRTERKVRDSKCSPDGILPRMLILADPCGDLTGAREEAKVIREDLDQIKKAAVSSKSTSISIDYVRKNIRDYDILHYAGHADYEGLSDKGGLRLCDGHLSVDDIVKLGISSPLPSLVFCNACQSALERDGDINKGVYGIANAFLTSGVRHYIGCLWKISDKFSMFMAQTFYREMLSGKTIAEALRMARVTLIQEHGEQTIVWASYVLYGDPSRAFGAPVEPLFLKQIGKPWTNIWLWMGVVSVMGMGLGASFYIPTIPPQPPTVVVSDFLSAGQQNKDLTLTYAVIEQLKRISSANLIDLDQRDGQRIELSKKIRRIVNVEYTRENGNLHLRIKITSPRTGEIVVVRESMVVENEMASRRIAEILLDLLKTGLPKNEQVELLREPSEDPVTHRILAKSMDFYLKGKYQEALKLCQSLLKTDPDNKDIYKRLGNIYDRLGQRDKALDVYLQYADLCGKTNDLKDLSNAYINIGWIKQVLGQDDEAFKYFNRALQISQLGEFDYEIAKGYSVLGGWYLKKKDYAQAKEMFSKSISINEKNMHDENHRYYLAANYEQLGITLGEEADWAGALKYLNLSMAMFKEANADRVVSEVKEHIEEIFKKKKAAEGML